MTKDASSGTAEGGVSTLGSPGLLQLSTKGLYKINTRPSSKKQPQFELLRVDVRNAGEALQRDVIGGERSRLVEAAYVHLSGQRNSERLGAEDGVHARQCNKLLQGQPIKIS